MEERDLRKLERDWRSMIFISHDFFHRWRQAVEEKYGFDEASALVNRFWELVGQGTGEAYLKRGKDTTDLAQVVKALVRASDVMGETARMEVDGDACLLVHDVCPWIDSFRDYGAEGQCQAGCDKWFATAAQTISPQIMVTTESCLADGGNTCTRRFVLHGGI